MKNGKLRIILISTFFLILVLPIMAGIMIYFIETLQFNFVLLKSIKITDFLNVNTYKNFVDFKNVHVINAICWIIIFWNIVGQLLNAAQIKMQSKYEQNDDYGSHGTAKFQTSKEMKKNYGKDKLGLFLGSEKKDAIYSLGMDAMHHKVNGDLNMQMTVVGPPGTNKTTGFIFPNIFHLVNEYKNNPNLGEMPDLIITDPKPEIIYSTYNFLEENNYNIVIYDFIFFKYGDKINILDFIDEGSEEEDLMNIADGYVHSIDASTGGGGNDGFWNEQEGQAFAALLGAIKQNYEKPKVEDVYDLLDKFVDSLDGSIDSVKANTYFKNNVKGSALRLWKNFLLICKSENTAGNILGGLAGKLKLFSIKGVRNLTSESTFNIRQLGAKNGDFGKDKPTAVFIFMKPESRTYAPIINVIITTLFNQLYSTARFYNGRLMNPVYFFIEEMANIGKLSGIQEKLGTMRGARIYPMMIWQSLSQMKERYKDGWEDIIAQCDTVVYLGFNDEFTAKYCSNSLGNTTIKTQGVSSKSLGYGIKDESESNNYTQRKLMFPEELMAMSRQEMIIKQGGYDPVRLYKVQYKHWIEKQRICEKIEQKDLPLLKEGFLNDKAPKMKLKDTDDYERERELQEHERNTEEHENEKVEKEEREQEINHFKLKRENTLER